MSSPAQCPYPTKVVCWFVDAFAACEPELRGQVVELLGQIAEDGLDGYQQLMSMSLIQDILFPPSKE